MYKDTLAGLIRERTSKAVAWRCDLSRLRNTRAKSAPRSVCTTLRGWRNCARARANTNSQRHYTRVRGLALLLLENPRISAGSSSKRRNRRMDRGVVCARADRAQRYTTVDTRTHTDTREYIRTLYTTNATAFLRGERVSVPRSRCQGQAPRSRLPAHSLATAFRIELPTPDALARHRAKRS